MKDHLYRVEWEIPKLTSGAMTLRAHDPKDAESKVKSTVAGNFTSVSLSNISIKEIRLAR